MTFGLDGKVALVTGGGRNIGREISLTLARHGCDVVVNDLAGADATAAEVRALGRRALAAAADVTDAGAVNAVCARAATELGRLDVVINCAVVLQHAPFLELDDARWRRMFDVIVNGAMNTSRAALPIMVERGGGSVVFISGAVIHRGTWPHLAAAKTALHGLARGLAKEFGPRGVRVNVVSPSTVGDVSRDHARDDERARAEIAITPLGRLATMTDVANVVTFLAGDMSSFVTGQSIHVNGGQYMP